MWSGSSLCSPWPRLRLAALVATAAIGIAAVGAQPALAVATQQLTGNPLTIWIGDNGSFQERVAGNTDNSFFPPTTPNGNAGFVLAFPTGQAAPYNVVDGQVWGWTSDGGGPTLDGNFTTKSQTAWTGGGSAADPYTQETKYVLKPLAVELLEVDQTATYINGSSNFVITYVIKELTGLGAVNFRALVGADVYLNSSDCGAGIFKSGPPRFVGGSSLGRVGGFTEALAPSPLWTHYFEGPYGGPGFPPGACQSDPTTSPGVWDYLAGATTGSGFPDTVNTTSIDNGIGIQWDTYYTSALPASGSSAPFQLNTLGTVPGELSLSPSSQTVKQGAQATITATARDSSGTGAADIPVRFSVSGANPGGGLVTTDGSGQATISYASSKSGTDSVAAFEDLDSSGVKDTGEPSATATVTVEGPPTAVTQPDRTPPKLTLYVRRSIKRKTLLKGLTAEASSNEPSSLRFELRGSRSRRTTAFSRVLAHQSLPTAGAGVRAVRLRPARKLLARSRRFTVQVRVTAIDRAGNRTVATQRIRVRR